MTHGSAALVTILVAAVGCDGGEMVVVPPDSGPMPDAAVDPMVTAPEIPWLDDGVPVVLTPCPEGWREVPGSVVECDPYPEAGPAECPAGEAHFPGESACRTVGDACPAGDYAEDVPTTGEVVFVNPAAGAGGDGSRGAPYASLAEAAPLGTGTTLVLSKGTFPGNLALTGGVTVLGACAGETVLTGEEGPALAAVISTSVTGPPELRNLTIAGSPAAGARVDNDRALNLTGVIVEGATHLGVYLGARSRVELRDVVVRGSLHGGVQVNQGSELVADRVLIASNIGIGIISFGPGARIDIADTAITGTDGNPGTGLFPTGGTEVSAERLLIAGSGNAGIAIMNADVRVEDTVVRGSRSTITSTPAVAVYGGSFEGNRLAVSDNRGVGLTTLGGATVLTDTVIRNTASTGPPGSGFALTMGDAATVEAQRLLIENNTEVAVYAEGGAAMTLTDVAVRGTVARPRDRLFGRGIEINGGTTMTATRLVIEGNRDASLFIEGEGTTAVLDDVVIRDTLSVDRHGIWGRGLQVQKLAQVTGNRVRVEASRDIGVVAANAELRLTDVTVTGVTPPDCVAAGDCVDGPYGYGVTAAAATLSLTRFAIEETPTCGIIIAPIPEERPPQVDLTEGQVRASEIGACVQVDGYDLMRLSNDVDYVDNGTNLDSTSLPVPGVDGI